MMVFFYSVPHIFRTQQVIARATSDIVEICDINGTTLAVHRRGYSAHKYKTNPKHMPTEHPDYWERGQWNGAHFRSWARSIGENTLHVINKMLDVNGIEEQAYNGCIGRVAV